MNKTIAFGRLFGPRLISFRRQRRLFAVVSILAFLGIGFGVLALLVALAVLSGFQREYKKAILQFNSHLVLMRADEIAEPEALKQLLLASDPRQEVEGMTPFIYREGLMVYQGNVKGLVLKGVQFETYQGLSGIALSPSNTPDDQTARELPGIYLGSEMAATLKYQGGTVKVLFPSKGQKRVGGQDFKEFRVLGTFTTGLYEYDNSFSLIALDQAQTLFQLPGKITGWELWLQDPDLAASFKQRIQEQLDWSYILLTWEELNENIFQALSLEKLIFSIIMLALIMVGSFNIIVSLIILILEKRAMVAVLRALGTSWPLIRRIFLLEGMGLALLGLALGVGMAAAVYALLSHGVGFELPQEIYFLSKVPVDWRWSDVGLACGGTILICLLASSLALRALNYLNIVTTLQEKS